MASQRIRAIYGSLSDIDYSELQTDFRSFSVTAAGLPADGIYIWDIAPVQGVGASVTFSRAAGESNDQIRDGWILDAVPGGIVRTDLQPFLTGLAVGSNPGELRATVRNSPLASEGGAMVTPFRVREVAVPGGASIVISPIDTFPNWVWLPPVIGPLVVELIPVTYGGDPVANPRGVSVPDDTATGMTVNFELLRVSDRQLPYGTETFGLSTTSLPSIRRGEPQNGWPVRELAVFPQWPGGFTSIRFFDDVTNPPSLYEGLEVVFYW